MPKDDEKPQSVDNGSSNHDVLEKLEEICSRLSYIEGKVLSWETAEDPSQSTSAGRGGHQQTRSPDVTKSNFEASFETYLSQSTLTQGSDGRGQFKDLFDKFSAIKDVVKDIPIPSDLLLSDGWFPVKDGRCMMGVIRKSYTYLLTTLKLLKKLHEETDVSDGAVKLLYTCLTAQAKYLQSESSTCFLEGAGSQKDPLSLYKALSTNTNLTQSDV